MSKLAILLFAMLWLDCVHAQFNIIVAPPGVAGNFTEIFEAIQAAPINRKNRFTIKVKAGVYRPFVVPKNKINIALIGDGMESTIVKGSNSNRTGFNLSETATVQVLGDNFMAQGISFRNTAGPTKGQAVALLVDAVRVVFLECEFDGYQDTLYVRRGLHFFRECHVFGTIDFIFGDARAVLQNSVIYLHQPLYGEANVITAQNRDNPTDNTGIVLHNCTIAAAEDFHKSSGVQTFLGRPWGNYSTTVVMQSYLPAYIHAHGWSDWNNQTYYRRDRVTYQEYNNRGPGAETSKRVNWRGFAVIRNISEAQKYTVKNFLDGNAWLPSTHVPFFPDLYH